MSFYSMGMDMGVVLQTVIERTLPSIATALAVWEGRHKCAGVGAPQMVLIVQH